jgi:crotonobetainyl-CoA:carnitine CoA-transferase CaiB-like acyl-CoA transferase
MKSRQELIETCIRLYESQRIMLAARLGIKPKVLLVSSNPKLYERFERLR